ncbi:MAG: hypothetical protein ACOCSA_02905 [Candidatus Hadarchaeota archaeon]
MTKFLIIEEPRDNRSIFYNFAVIEAESEEDAEEKYLDKIDVDKKRNILNVFDLNSIDTDYYQYLEIEAL